MWCAGYQALGEESMPLVFVLMGNFHSKAASGEGVLAGTKPMVKTALSS
jgi:hypothetical protein